jgi:hypothetical protein
MADYGIRLNADASGLVGATEKSATAAEKYAGTLAALAKQAEVLGVNVKSLERDVGKYTSSQDAYNVILEKVLQQEIKHAQALGQLAPITKSAADETRDFTARLKEKADTLGKTGTALERGSALLGSFQSALAAVGVTVGAGAMVSLYSHVLGATAALHKMAEQSGATVEGLSKIQTVAKIGGYEFGGFAETIARMIRGLKSANEEGQAAGRALDFLGIKAKDADGVFRDGAEIVQDVSKALAKYEDGGNKVALMLDLIGRGGSRHLSLMKNLADEGEQQAKVTAQQAEEALRLEKEMNRLKIVFEDHTRALVIGVTPAITAWLEATREGIKIAGGFGESLRLFAFNLDAMTTERPVEEIKRLTKAFDDYRNAGLSVLGMPLPLNPVTQGISRFLQSPTGAIFGGREEDLKKQIELLKYLERQEALAGAGPQNYDARDLMAHPALKPRLDYESAARGGAGAGAAPVSDFDRLEKQIVQMDALTDSRAGSTDKLTEAERKLTEVQALYEAGLTNLTPKEFERLQNDLASIAVRQQAIAQRERERKAVEDATKAYNSGVDTQWKSIASLKDHNAKLEEHNLEIGKTKEQIDLLRASRAEETLAIAQENLTLTQMHDASADELALAQARVQAAQDLVRLSKEGAVKEGAAAQAKAAEEAFKHTANTIDTALSTSIADGLMRGFRKGEDTMKNFVQTMENAFKSAVLTPVIRYLTAPVSAAIAGMLPNFAGAAGFAGGGGLGGGLNVLSGANSANNLFGGGISNFLSSGSGFGNFLAGGSVGGGTFAEATALAGGTGAFDAGAFMASDVGLGAMGAVGSAIPYVGIGLAALSLLGAWGGGGGGPKPSQIQLQGDPGGSFNIGQIDTPGGWGNLGLYQSVSAAFNDPAQYDQQKLNALKGHYIQGGAGEDAQSMVNRLLAYLAPAAIDPKAALDASNFAAAVDQMRGSLKAAMDPLGFWSDTVAKLGADLGSSATNVSQWQGQFLAALDAPLSSDQLVKWQQLGAALQQLGTARDQAANAAAAVADSNAQAVLAQFGLQGQLVSSIQQFQESQLVSPYLSPTARLAGARTVFEDTLAGARGGDATSIQALFGSSQTLLSAGRDVFASGPDFAALMVDVNREMADTLKASGAKQGELLAELPISIKQASQDQIDAIEKQTAALMDQLRNVRSELGRIAMALT